MVHTQGCRRARWLAAMTGLVVAAATFAANSGAASARATSWEAPRTLGASQPYSEIGQLAVNGDGLAAVGWDSTISEAPDWREVAEIATRDAAGVWSKPVRLDEASGLDVSAPRVVISRSGVITAVWAVGDAGYAGCGVRSASKKPGVAWSAPITISTECADQPLLGGDAAGDAVLVWEDLDTRAVSYATMSPVGTWTAPTRMSFERPLNALGLATNASGASTLILGYPKVGLFAARRTTGSDWTSPVKISGTKPVGYSTVAMSKAGDATVAWWIPYRRAPLFAVTRPAGGHWSKPSVVDQAGGELSTETPGLTYNRGTALAVWEDVGGDVKFSSKATGHPWRKPVLVSDKKGSHIYDGLTVDPGGTITVAWSRFFGGTVQAVSKAPGGHWTNPRSLTGKKGYALHVVVASGGNGKIDVAWEDRVNQHTYEIKTTHRG